MPTLLRPRSTSAWLPVVVFQRVSVRPLLSFSSSNCQPFHRPRQLPPETRASDELRERFRLRFARRRRPLLLLLLLAMMMLLPIEGRLRPWIKNRLRLIRLPPWLARCTMPPPPPLSLLPPATPTSSACRYSSQPSTVSSSASPTATPPPEKNWQPTTGSRRSQFELRSRSAVPVHCLPHCSASVRRAQGVLMAYLLILLRTSQRHGIRALTAGIDRTESRSLRISPRPVSAAASVSRATALYAGFVRCCGLQ